MLWQNYLALGVLGCVLLLSATTADNSVHILSKYGHQPLTSTTLKWLPVLHYNPSESKEIIIGGFENLPGNEDENNANQAEKLETRKQLALYVCRAMHSGVWVAGTQKEKEKVCTVTIHGVVQSYPRYELLENVDGAARMLWIHWDRYTQPHLGAVYVDKMLVARHEVPEDKRKPRYTHNIGTLSSFENFGTIVYVNEIGKEESAKTGELLVEIEPIRYELSAVKLHWSKRRDIKRVPRVLGEVTITSEVSSGNLVRVAEALPYTYKYSVYWGRRHAILNGLSTTITLMNDTSLPNITWGTRDEENRTELYDVVVYLEPGTGVNVTLRANYTDMEVPYTAKLISHYEDNTTTSRIISGTRQEEALFDITPEFGPIYFLSNYSLVPTTTPPPTTTTEPPTTTLMTTTTTMATTAKQPQETSRETHRHRMDNASPDMVDENSILPKPDISTGMQNDDRSPQLLQNNVMYGGATSVALQSSLFTLVIPLLLLLILHKIT